MALPPLLRRYLRKANPLDDFNRSLAVVCPERHSRTVELVVVFFVHDDSLLLLDLPRKSKSRVFPKFFFSPLPPFFIFIFIFIFIFNFIFRVFRTFCCGKILGKPAAKAAANELFRPGVFVV